MKSRRLRTAVPIAVLVAIGVGFALNLGTGTLSALGFGDIALLCPLGAIESMLGSKAPIARTLVALVVAVALILLFGRAFCSWVCPVPFVSRLRNAFRRMPAARGGDGERNQGSPAAPASRSGAGTGAASGSAACPPKRTAIDSRHFVLGGALLSAAVFGFPVFCLVCPIGLTFATVLLVMLLFGGGDVTWSVVVAPALLLVEVVLFRQWCSKLCPLAALMSLVAKGNRTFRPVVDRSACLESGGRVVCGRCAASCEQGIDVRHLAAGSPQSECTRCRSCVDACPAHAVSIPLLAKRAAREKGFGESAKG